MATHSSVLAWRIPRDRGTWWATVHGIGKSWTRLSTGDIFQSPLWVGGRPPASGGSRVLLSIPQCTGHPITETDLVPRVNRLNKDGIHFPSELGPESQGSHPRTFIPCCPCNHTVFGAHPETMFGSLLQGPEG